MFVYDYVLLISNLFETAIREVVRGPYPHACIQQPPPNGMGRGDESQGYSLKCMGTDVNARNSGGY